VSEILCEWVRQDFDIDLVSAHPAHHGADSAADVWRGFGADGSSYAVKLSGGGSAAGLIVCASLVLGGVHGIPRPIPTADGRLWSDREGARLSLAPWVSDERAFDGNTTAAHWTAYGTLLSGLHRLPVSDELGHVLPRETHTHERIAALTRDIDARLKQPADDPLVQTLATQWFRSGVLGVLERADVLGAALRNRTDLPDVICHADPHLGNLLIGPGGEVWLIDWDDVVLAPPERDLMFILGEIFGGMSEEEQRLFFDAYGDVQVDPDRLAYYRAVRTLEDAVGSAAEVLDVDGRTDQEREEALEIACGVLSLPHGYA
jgi:spectinomycin phosphotransferase